MGFLKDFFAFWIKATLEFKSLQADTEKRPKTVRFGVKSIIFSIVGPILVGLCVMGIFGLIGWYDGLSPDFSKLGGLALMAIGVFICGAMAIGFFVRFIIYGLFAFIYQLRLNKKAIGWIAMVVWIITTVAMPVCIYFIIF